MKIPRSFRWTGYLEGGSFLFLLLVAMPLKYIWDLPQAVRIVGSLHGVFFLLYVGLATFFAFRLGWSRRALIYSYLASMLPFGPFLFDRWMLKKLSA